MTRKIELQNIKGERELRGDDPGVPNLGSRTPMLSIGVLSGKKSVLVISFSNG